MSLRRVVLRGGAYLALRQLIGLALNLGGVLLLTRWIGPGEYGRYAVAFSVLGFLTLLSQWGIGTYLVRREAAEETDDVYHEAFSLLLALSLAGVLVGVAAAPLLALWTKVDGITPIAIAVFLTLPITVVAVVPIVRLERRLDYRRVAWLEIGAQAGFFIVALPLARMGRGAWAPVAGWWMQQGLLAALAFGTAGYAPRFAWNGQRIREMIGYGLGYSSSIWLWQLRRLVNPLIVGRWVGAEAVGHVSVATQIAGNLSFAQSASWRIATAALAKVQNEPARLARALGDGMRLQLLGVGPLLVAFGLMAPVLVPRLLGREWAGVTLIYPWVALAFLGFAVFNLHSSALYVLRRNWDVSLYHLVHVAIFASAALILVPRFGIIGYGWAEGITLLGYYVIHRIAVRRIGPIDYGMVLPASLAFAAALFWQDLGWWSVPGLVLLALWPRTWRELWSVWRALRQPARSSA